jgi:hypothetical protein
MDAHFYALHHGREAIVGDSPHPGRQMAQRLEDCMRRMRGLVEADAHSGQGWLTKGMSGLTRPKPLQVEQAV